MQKRKWAQIESEIIRYISDHSLIEGNRLPKDAELAEKFNCSLQPVIRAMQELARRGVVKRGRGARTVVRSLPASIDDHEFSFATSVTDCFGSRLENKIIEQALRAPGNNPREVEAHEALGLSGSSSFLVISRLRIVDGQRKAIHRAFLDPARFSRAFLSGHDFERESLIQIYREKGYQPAMRDTVVAARLADEEEQAVLGISELPILETRQKLYSIDPGDNQTFVLEYLHATYIDWEYRILNRR